MSSTASTGGGLEEALGKFSRGEQPTPVKPATTTPVTPPKPEAPKVDAAKPEAKPGEKPATTAPKEGQKPEHNFAALKTKAEAWDKGEIPPAAKAKFEALERQAQEAVSKVQQAEERLKTFQSEYDGEKGRYTENQTWRMAYDLQSSPEYQQQVAAPFSRIMGNVQAIAQEFGVDANTLWGAVNEPNAIKRSRAIHALTKEHEEGQVINGLVNEEVKNLGAVAEKNAEMESKSEELRNQISAKRATETQQQTQQQKAEEEKSRAETMDILKSKLADVFASQDPEIQSMLSAAESAKFDDSPMGRAMAARLPDVVFAQNKLITSLKSELDSSKRTIEELSGARPGMGAVATVETEGAGNAKPASMAESQKAAAEGFASGLAKFR